MGLPNLPFARYLPSKQLINGADFNGLNDQLNTFQGTITATPAGTAVTSFKLNAAFNEVTVVATANDGVVLPPAKVGLRVCVTNSDAADSLRIFGNGTDTINAGSANVDLAAAGTALFVCTKNGIWKRFVSA